MKQLEQDVLAIMLGEALHPNQQKIDVVDDDKIDGKDFAKLRSMKNKKTGKIHNCAVHVEHPEYGIGECISEAHADPDKDGNIAWYTVKFEDSTQVVQTEDIKVLASESHMHNEEVEQTDEAMSHQAATTMKHIKPGTLKQNYGDKKDAANIKPGIKGVADRIAMLDRAKKEGRLKEEVGTELEEAKGLSSMTIDQLKQEHEKVMNKINDQGKSKMISMNHPLSQRARSIRLHMAIKKKQANEEVQPVEEMDKSMAYATGTKRAMQMTGDKPPLEKSTIKKAHKIAKAMLRKEEVEEDQFSDYDELIEGKPFEFEVEHNYNFGDYLKTAKHLVGEEDAINLANEAFNKQDISLFVEEMTRNEVESRVKTHMNAGHEVSTPKYSTRDGKFHAEFIVKDKESGVRRKYIYHGNTRKMENMGTPGKRD